MNRTIALAAAAALGIAGALVAFAPTALGPSTTRDAARLAWTEVQWPFPTDPWGRGRAFRCGPTECAAEVHLYLRAKLGFCNCVTGIADDADLDGMGDLTLVGGAATPLGDGRPVAIGWMKGRARAYARAHGQDETVLSVAFNDRCDMVVATIVLPRDRLEAIEPNVIAFLNSETVLNWTRATLGI